MIPRSVLRALGYLSFAVAGAPRVVAGQALDRTLSSMVGGVIGGFGGIVLSLPQGCGGVFSDRICTLHTVAKGFGVGNVLGSAFGAARSGGAPSCSPAERFGRSLMGTLAGGGVTVAAVSQAHGNLRIGLTPLVQLAEGVGAAAMLSPCSWTPSAADSAAIRFSRECHNPSRGLARTAAGLGLTGGYAGLYLYFRHAWWSGTPAPKWFVENDWDREERDADKFGHLFGGYQLTRVTSELLQAGCVPPSRAAALAALYAYAFQFQIEEWDGTQQLYGFNPSDLIADATGALFAVAQQHAKALQYIKPVWSYRPTEAYRRRNLPGHGGQPRATTDYSGQTYWFSTDVHGLLPERAKPFWPSFIRLSPGYSITDYVNPATGGALRARRKILVSLDIDPEHLPGDNKVWRTIKHELAFFRIPGPTLQLTPTRRFFLAYY
ncbi:MAG TPA: DUF2279 domain-containing protein [Gemmatimonadaceae bacterium]